MNALSVWKAIALVGCVVGFFVVTVALPMWEGDEEEHDIPIVAVDTSAATENGDSAPQEEKLSPALIAALGQQYTFDTLHSDGQPHADTSVIAKAGVSYGGRKVSISVCGVDSRLGEHVEHADANHIITVWLDSGRVTIASIPRDTPCDAGYENQKYNILANIRARKGRDAYVREVAAIVGLDTIEYYVDLGFSQARGVLELLGFRGNSSDALKVLRSRHAFASGDYQRCYNQGQFIRQMLLKRFKDLDGITGALLLRAGLLLVNTNLTVDAINNIQQALQQRGFPENTDAIALSIQPAYYAKMAVFNFRDSTVLGSLLTKVNHKAQKMGISTAQSNGCMAKFRQEVDARIAKAIADSAQRPRRVVQLLQRPFEQRVWWQLASPLERAEVRSALGALLADAYKRLHEQEKAERVLHIVAFEQQYW